MNAAERARQPKGVPTGGQFAAQGRDEADVDLDGQPTPEVVSLWDASAPVPAKSLTEEIAERERTAGRPLTADEVSQTIESRRQSHPQDPRLDANLERGWSAHAWTPGDEIEPWETEVLAVAGLTEDDLVAWAGSGKQVSAIAILHQAGLTPDSAEDEQRAWAANRFLELARSADDRHAYVDSEDIYWEKFDGNDGDFRSELDELDQYASEARFAAEHIDEVEGVKFHDLPLDIAEMSAVLTYDLEADLTPECEAAAKLHR